MAPEQARGLSVSPRSDVYALGVIAFELFTGRVPFTGATPMDVMVAHVGSPPPSPRSFEPVLPISLEVLVLRMLAKAPDARPQSVDEVRAELEEAVVQLGGARPRGSRELPALTLPSSPALPPMFAQTPAPVPVPVPEPEPAVIPRSKAGVWMAVVVLLGLAASGAAWVMTRPLAELPRPAPVVVVAVDASVEVDASVDAGADQPDAGEDSGLIDAGIIDAGIVDAGVVEAPIDAKTLKRAPTVRQLKDRIAKLEARAKKKRGFDKTSLVALRKLRAEALVADSPVKRVRVDRSVTEWERANLPRK
jgi:serine/threonine-protein kinase